MDENDVSLAGLEEWGIGVHTMIGKWLRFTVGSALDLTLVYMFH
jgi:hypothetical protein